MMLHAGSLTKSPTYADVSSILSN